eukprot:1996631-Rhodomonas_salina.1
MAEQARQNSQRRAVLAGVAVSCLAAVACVAAVVVLDATRAGESQLLQSNAAVHKAKMQSLVAGPNEVSPPPLDVVVNRWSVGGVPVSERCWQNCALPSTGCTLPEMTCNCSCPVLEGSLCQKHAREPAHSPLPSSPPPTERRAAMMCR